jgi:two-component system, cell cycle response regulator
VFSRYGGEEFVIVLPETQLEGAVTLAETLRKRVAEHKFVFQGESINVTVSMGCAAVQPEDTASDIIARADTKLYEAKRSGRNKVCN